MIDLRKFARETDVGCQIRIVPHCNWEPTCLCHLRIANVAGKSQKPPDLCGVIGCDACHGILDRRTHLHEYTKDEISLLTLDALVRTLAIYHKHFQMTERG